MKKTEIRVTIDSVEKQQRAIEILGRYGEKIWGNECAMKFDKDWKNLFFSKKGGWLIGLKNNKLKRTEITLDELEELLKAEK